MILSFFPITTAATIILRRSPNTFAPRLSTTATAVVVLMMALLATAALAAEMAAAPEGVQSTLSLSTIGGAYLDYRTTGSGNSVLWMTGGGVADIATTSRNNTCFLTGIDLMTMEIVHESNIMIPTSSSSNKNNGSSSQQRHHCTALARLGPKLLLLGYNYSSSTTVMAAADGLLWSVQGDDGGLSKDDDGEIVVQDESHQLLDSDPPPSTVFPVAMLATYDEIQNEETIFAVSRTGNNDQSSSSTTTPLDGVDNQEAYYYPAAQDSQNMSIHILQRQPSTTTSTFMNTTASMNMTSSQSMSRTASYSSRRRDGLPLPILVSDLLWLKTVNELVVVGSTRGEGRALGYRQVGMGNYDNYDGFVARIDPTTGYPVNNNNPTAAAMRIESTEQKDDWIASVCAARNNEDFIYVVGSTAGTLSPTATSNGDGTMQAYMAKVQVSNWDILWVTQIGARNNTTTGSVIGLSCAVTFDGTEVWIGGNVAEGVTVVGESTTAAAPYGGTDVFVAKLRTSDGSLEFTRQMGSPADEGLLVSGGITTDAVTGDAIVAGFTYGSWFRARSWDETSKNIFVTTVSRQYVATTPAPATPAPIVGAATTTAPVIAMAPATSAPVSSTPTTSTPSTQAPTSLTPATIAPVSPSTSPMTAAPGSLAPATSVPSISKTASPILTSSPISAAPTLAPIVTSSGAPTTGSPITSAPVMNATTAAPTRNPSSSPTPRPTTKTPSTEAPNNDKGLPTQDPKTIGLNDDVSRGNGRGASTVYCLLAVVGMLSLWEYF